MNEKIKVVSGNTGSPLENFGLANFIQVYIYDKPYFRYDDKRHSKLLENLLKEFDLPFDTMEISGGSFYSLKIPKPRGENYSLAGEGQINEGYIIKKEDVHELGSQDYYAVFPSASDYSLFPSLSHLNKVLPYFDRPIIFASQEYQTEEQKGFLNWDPEDEPQEVNDPEDLAY
ncbi:MAG: hypothetical protein Q8O84_04830 [Nanoarchaeota archaeon]|nr:hypothetical protein [Nanoarchaeota archaeon]